MKRYFELVRKLQDNVGIHAAKRMAKKQVIKEMMADLKYHDWPLEERVQKMADLIEAMNIDTE